MQYNESLMDKSGHTYRIGLSQLFSRIFEDLAVGNLVAGVVLYALAVGHDGDSLVLLQVVLDHLFLLASIRQDSGF